jgi:hypothetical protein
VLQAVVPVRKALRVRTAFNLLGPMLNPADAAYGLVGVYSTSISHLMADALQVGGGGGGVGVGGWHAGTVVASAARLSRARRTTGCFLEPIGGPTRTKEPCLAETPTWPYIIHTKPAQAWTSVKEACLVPLEPAPPALPQRLGVKKALVVHSAGLDELTPMAHADVVEVTQSGEAPS